MDLDLFKRTWRAAELRDIHARLERAKQMAPKMIQYSQEEREKILEVLAEIQEMIQNEITKLYGQNKTSDTTEETG